MVSVLELILVGLAIVFSVLWVAYPGSPYEPIIAACSAIAVGLDLLRRYLRSSQLKIFLSVGATYTKQQEDYVLAFERMLTQHDCRRLVVGRDAPPSRQPMLEVKDLMKEADAVVVLAFTRYVITSGEEKPAADLSGQEPRTIADERHPTVWNQIEAGMAFGLGKPLMVIVEEGLKNEAMLRDRHEFMVRTMPLDGKYFENPTFQKVFVDFVRRARRRSWRRL